MARGRLTENLVWGTVVVAMTFVGCNFFKTSSPIAPTDGGEAVGVEMGDQAGGRDAELPGDNGTASPDGGDACLPSTGEAFCAGYEIDCGELFARGDEKVWEAEDLVPEPSDSCALSDVAELCSSSPTIELDFVATTDGDFLVELLAGGQFWGPPPALVRLTVDDEFAADFPIYAPRDALVRHGRIITLQAGDHHLSWQFINDAFQRDVGDRDASVDKVYITPVAPVVDSCGETFATDCGECPGETVCGFTMPGKCGCPCPLPGGGCAAPGPDPDNPCAECTAEGWVGVDASCSDGDPCTDDACNDSTALCRSQPVVCDAGGECEVGTCVGGSCETSTADDGSPCGSGGICSGGVCGCPDGTTVEQNCHDNRDNDCDGDMNCADNDCDGQTCGGGQTCSGGVCQ